MATHGILDIDVIGNTLWYKNSLFQENIGEIKWIMTDVLIRELSRAGYGIHKMRGEAMEWKTDSIKISVEDCGNYIQIAKPNIFDSSCKISLRPEDVHVLNHWLMEAKSKALELQESAINMANEGGPV